MSYRVTAGYVTVETAVPGGRAAVDIPRGDVLPADVPDERVRTLIDLGQVASAEQSPPHDPPTETGPELSAGPPSGPPPRRGAGSGLEPWTAYANGYGIAVPEGYGRDQVRDMLAEHGIPVE